MPVIAGDAEGADEVAYGVVFEIEKIVNSKFVETAMDTFADPASILELAGGEDGIEIFLIDYSEAVGLLHFGCEFC